MVFRPGVWNSSGARSPSGSGDGRRCGTLNGLLEIRRIAALAHVTTQSSPASDATMNSCDWLPPMAPECASTAGTSRPQRSKMRQYAAVLFVGGVQSCGVHVEGVGILHDELAHAQQAAFRTRLIAELGLDLVPDLGQLFVAPQFPRARHRSSPPRGSWRGTGRVRSGPSTGTSCRPWLPSGRTPATFRRDSTRQQELLRADRVHLLADDGRDLEQRTLGQEQVAVYAAGELADIARAQQQLVAATSASRPGPRAGWG